MFRGYMQSQVTTLAKDTINVVLGNHISLLRLVEGMKKY